MSKKGIPKTEEHKRKIRESNLAHPERHIHWIGRHHTEESKKKIGISNSIALKGRKLSIITRQRISEAMSGEGNPSWRGGVKKIIKQQKIAGRERPEKCEICGKSGRICFDHDHKMGKFRGWICSRCNVVIGLVEEDKTILLKIIKYLP